MMNSAHEASLLLLDHLRYLTVEPASSLADSVLHMNFALMETGLHADIRPTVVFGGQHPFLSLEAHTEFGLKVTAELLSCSEFFPCPEDLCEAKGGEACKWCGRKVR
jgi:hypothetical protein